MEYDQALNLANEYLAKEEQEYRDAGRPVELKFYKIIEDDFVWVFFWQSKECVEKGGTTLWDASPVFVDKLNGTFRPTSSRVPFYYIREYEILKGYRKVIYPSWWKRLFLKDYPYWLVYDRPGDRPSGKVPPWWKRLFLKDLPYFPSNHDWKLERELGFKTILSLK